MKRYPGVSPFTSKQANIFFGRDNDIEKLQQLISLRKQVLLYSKSGLGKTSLLNAGVLPKLEPRFSVLRVRFFVYIEDKSQSPVNNVIEVLKSSISEFEQLQSTILDELVLNKEYEKSLWFYFKNIQLTGRRKFILVFDQFEELFSYPTEQVELFKDQLHELLDVDVPDDIMRLIAKNIGIEEHAQIDDLYQKLDLRAVYAIRSDRMSLLNNLTDKIPDIQKTFYELKPLDSDQAKLAIINPSDSGADNLESFESMPFKFAEDAVDKIILKLSMNGKQAIDITQLQIVCQRIEAIAKLKQTEGQNEKQVKIEISDLPDFKDIYLNFYKEAVNNTTEPENARKFIEDQLIKKSQRISLDTINCEYFVRAETLNKLVDSHLLKVEPNTTGGFNYELSHDNLIEPIFETAQQRRRQEAADLISSKEKAEYLRIQKETRFKFVAIAACFAFILVILASWGWYSSLQKSTEMSNLLFTFVPISEAHNEYEYAERKAHYYLHHGDEQPYESPAAYGEAIKFLTLEKYCKDLPKTISKSEIDEQKTNLKKCSELLPKANQAYYQGKFKEADLLYNEVINLNSKIRTPILMKEFCKPPTEHFMIDVLAGKYLLDDGSSHLVVNISKSFKISKYEITNAQFVRFLNDYRNDTIKEGVFKGQPMIRLNGAYVNVKCHIEKKDGRYLVEQGFECFPVIYVSWFGAKEYCSFYGGNLPTEAQWEYAAAGGHKSGNKDNNIYKRQYIYAGGNNLRNVGWYNDNSDLQEHLVGSLMPNQLGLYDMSGNVWEWCHDWYKSEYPEGEIENYSDTIATNQRVVRGCAFNFLNDTTTKSCSVNMRGTYRPQYTSSCSGFRFVLNQ